MRIRETILVCLGALAGADAGAETLQFVCVGEELIYTETFGENQENLTRRPRTIQIELNREKKTMSVSGTTNADGKGALEESTASFATSFQRARVIYEIPFKYVLAGLSQARNELSILATTHLDLAEPDAEGRLLFKGLCRPPKRKSE
jgi:hypothetical protein